MSDEELEIEIDASRSVSTNQTATPPRQTLGVAISGGGVRAALYSAGSLLYLVHAGLNRDIRLVSSVSGGSIVNAAVAMNGDLANTDPVGFGQLTARLSHRMSRKGVFFWPGIRRMSLSVAAAALFAPIMIGYFNILGIEDGWSWRTFWFLEVPYVTVLTLYLFAYTVLSRRSIQQNAYEQFINHVGRTKGHPTLSEFPASEVTHVLCATELTSGQPFYMSDEMLYCPAYGRAEPDLRIAQAIYASAAFPIGFPPLRLKSEDLRLTGGWEDDPPDVLFLSDGGVFNNLGTDAFSANDVGEQIYLPDPTLPVIPQVDRHIVINASAPAKVTRLPKLAGWRTVKTTARIMSVLYENTLRPRVQRLMEDQDKPRGPIVIDISESPVELVDRLATDGANDDVRKRALELRDLLSRAGSDYEWKTYSNRAALTKTVLSAVGRPAAMRLIRLGYLEASIACHISLGTQGVEFAPSVAWFRDLVNDSLTDEQARQPAHGSLSQSR